jgi:hypothetical protein
LSGDGEVHERGNNNPTPIKHHTIKILTPVDDNFDNEAEGRGLEGRGLEGRGLEGRGLEGRGTFGVAMVRYTKEATRI